MSAHSSAASSRRVSLDQSSSNDSIKPTKRRRVKGDRSTRERENEEEKTEKEEKSTDATAAAASLPSASSRSSLRTSNFSSVLTTLQTDPVTSDSASRAHGVKQPLASRTRLSRDASASASSTVIGVKEDKKKDASIAPSASQRSLRNSSSSKTISTLSLTSAPSLKHLTLIPPTTSASSSALTSDDGTIISALHANYTPAVSKSARRMMSPRRAPIKIPTSGMNVNVDASSQNIVTPSMAFAFAAAIPIVFTQEVQSQSIVSITERRPAREDYMKPRIATRAAASTRPSRSNARPPPPHHEQQAHTSFIQIQPVAATTSRAEANAVHQKGAARKLNVAGVEEKDEMTLQADFPVNTAEFQVQFAPPISSTLSFPPMQNQLPPPQQPSVPLSTFLNNHTSSTVPVFTKTTETMKQRNGFLVVNATVSSPLAALSQSEPPRSKYSLLTEDDAKFVDSIVTADSLASQHDEQQPRGETVPTSAPTLLHPSSSAAHLANIGGNTTLDNSHHSSRMWHSHSGLIKHTPQTNPAADASESKESSSSVATEVVSVAAPTVEMDESASNTVHVLASPPLHHVRAPHHHPATLLHALLSPGLSTSSKSLLADSDPMNGDSNMEHRRKEEMMRKQWSVKAYTTVNAKDERKEEQTTQQQQKGSATSRSIASSTSKSARDQQQPDINAILRDYIQHSIPSSYPPPLTQALSNSTSSSHTSVASIHGRHAADSMHTFEPVTSSSSSSVPPTATRIVSSINPNRNHDAFRVQNQTVVKPNTVYGGVYYALDAKEEKVKRKGGAAAGQQQQRQLMPYDSMSKLQNWKDVQRQQVTQPSQPYQFPPTHQLDFDSTDSLISLRDFGCGRSRSQLLPRDDPLIVEQRMRAWQQELGVLPNMKHGGLAAVRPPSSGSHLRNIDIIRLITRDPKYNLSIDRSNEESVGPMWSMFNDEEKLDYLLRKEGSSFAERKKEYLRPKTKDAEDIYTTGFSGFDSIDSFLSAREGVERKGRVFEQESVDRSVLSSDARERASRDGKREREMIRGSAVSSTISLAATTPATARMRSPRTLVQSAQSTLSSEQPIQLLMQPTSSPSFSSSSDLSHVHSTTKGTAASLIVSDMHRREIARAAERTIAKVNQGINELMEKQREADKANLSIEAEIWREAGLDVPSYPSGSQSSRLGARSTTPFSSTPQPIPVVLPPDPYATSLSSSRLTATSKYHAQRLGATDPWARDRRMRDGSRDMEAEEKNVHQTTGDSAYQQIITPSSARRPHSNIHSKLLSSHSSDAQYYDLDQMVQHMDQLRLRDEAHSITASDKNLALAAKQKDRHHPLIYSLAGAGSGQQSTASIATVSRDVSASPLPSPRSDRAASSNLNSTASLATVQSTRDFSPTQDITSDYLLQLTRHRDETEMTQFDVEYLGKIERKHKEQMDERLQMDLQVHVLKEQEQEHQQELQKKEEDRLARMIKRQDTTVA